MLYMAAGGVIAGLVSWPLYGTAGKRQQHAYMTP